MSEISPLEREDAADDERNQRLASLLLEVARAIDPDVARVLPRQTPTDPRLEAVRSVLMRRELDLLERLEERFDDPERLADTVGHALPRAFELAGARDERLGLALAPTMERATQASIRKNPGTLVNILYPLMGPAIRKAIAETMNDTLQGLNQALRFAFSPRGLKWRFEAMRSGSSFADIVLKHTLVFRVEHLFLIHRKSGLLLEHVAAADTAARDPHLVSGMLTAIQDFVRDSFEDSGSPEGGAIDSLRLGDLLIWCEAGPQAYLAAVIRGNPPETLRAGLRDTLASIHEDMRTALEDYAGDNSTLGDLPARLDPCLKQQVQPPERRLSVLIWLIPLALLGALGWFFWSRHLDDAKVAAYVEALRQQPGIVVTGTERRDGHWYINGMRDPLAVDPTALSQRAEIEAGVLVEHFEPYAALSPRIVLRRLRASLPQLPSVHLTLDGDTIRFGGGVPVDWLEKARALVRSMPAGSPPVDLSGLTDVEDPDYLRLRDEIQSARILFSSGAPNPAADQDAALDRLAANLKALIEVAHRLGFSVRMSIVGHADATGKITSNLGLSIARAEVVRSMLRGRGIAPELMNVRGTGTLEPVAEGEAPDDMSLNRSVSFTITTTE